jgi:hypothetical protein
MNCTESHDLLQQRLDGEPIADRAALDHHLSACPDCRVLHAAAGRFEDGLRLLTPPTPPTGLVLTITRRVLDDRRQRLRRRRWFAAAALAAGLLLAVFLGTWSPRQVEQLARVSGPIKVEAAPSVRGSLFEIGSEITSLTRRTADETVGQTKLFLPETLPAPPLTESPAVQISLDAPAQTWKEASAGVSSAIDPVTSSARRMFGMLMREPPSLEQNQ